MIFPFVRMHVFLKDKNVHISIDIYDKSCGQLLIHKIYSLLIIRLIDSLVIVNSLKCCSIQVLPFHDS